MIEENKVYFLTRIFKSNEYEGRVLSACLEPLFTEFDEDSFNENIDKIIMLDEDNDASLLRSLNDDFIDGSFVRIKGLERERYFELANNSNEAQEIISLYNEITNVIQRTNEL